MQAERIRIFHYAARLSNGRRQTGSFPAEDPQAAVERLMARKFCHAEVFEQRADGARIQVGGIAQTRKGSRRTPWYEGIGPYAR